MSCEKSERQSQEDRKKGVVSKRVGTIKKDLVNGAIRQFGNGEEESREKSESQEDRKS